MRSTRARFGWAATFLAVGATACSSSASSHAAPAAGPAAEATIPAVAPSGPPPDASGRAGATAWPAALHDRTHSGTASVNGPQSAATRWTRKLEGPISAGPVVAADGTIYASSNGGVLHALDPATGTDRWTFNGGGTTDNGQDLSTSPALLADGTILWPGPGGKLIALDRSGKMVWSETLHGTVLSPAITDGGKVYVTDSMGGLVAIQTTPDGDHRLWSTTVGKASFGTPAVGHDGTVYATADRDLVALSDEGDHPTIKWRFTAGAEIEVSPSIADDGTIIVGTNDPFEYGISPAGTVRWKYPRKVFSYSTPAASGNLAYFGDNDGYVDVVNAKDGTVVGRYDGTAKPISTFGVGVWTAPLVDAAHNVYFGTASGHIFGFAYNGRKLFDLDTGAIVDSYPALTADGALIIGSDNATLYAVHG